MATKVATQVAVALAAAATYSGERLTRSAVRERLVGRGLLGTAALAAALEVSLTALPVSLLVTTWTYYSSFASAMESLCGYTLFTVALLLHVYLGTVIPVSVAASAADRGCHTVWALRRAWRLVRSRKRKEAAVLVFLVYVLPAVVYPAPVYAFSFVYPADEYSMFYYPYQVEHNSRFSGSNAVLQGQDVWLLGVVSGSGLPTVGAQLFSMVTATVFCCLAMNSNAGGCMSI